MKVEAVEMGGRRSVGGALQAGSKAPRERLQTLRFLMVLGSMAPLFVLFFLKGVPTLGGRDVVPEIWFNSACALLIGLPTAIVAWRMWIVRHREVPRERVAGAESEAKDHLLVYLFAMVIPLYQTAYSSMGEVYAVLFLIALILFVFWHLNLHYMNLLFALAGYRVFTVRPPEVEGGRTARPYVLLSKRHHLVRGERFSAYRLSDSVYLEYGG